MSLDAILPEPLALTSGIVAMPADEYHADPCPEPSLSKSVAHILLEKSPAHARVAHPKLYDRFVREEKEIFDIGTVVHALLLEGAAGVEVVEAKDWTTKVAKEQRDAAREAGKVPLLTSQWARCEEMANAARRQLEMLDLDPAPFTAGKPEQTLVWEEDGVYLRCRFDWLHDDLSTVDDYKTTGTSAVASEWRKVMLRTGADLQAAFYLRGLRKALGAETNWRWVIQETSPPFALTVAYPGPDVLARAELRVQHAIDTWRSCLADNHWPAYTREAQEITLPAWPGTGLPIEEDYGDAPF